MEAAGAVDAKNAPTAPWKTGRPVFHSYHRLLLLSRVTGKVLPMFPVNFVTYVPGCTKRYFVPLSVRKSVCTFVRQLLRGPHFSTRSCARIP